MAKTPQFDFYRDDDLILGFCGPGGAYGVYRYWLGREPSGRAGGKPERRDQWEFCPPDTRAWDGYHQRVFFQGRADCCSLDDLGGSVPPLPAEFPPPQALHVADPPSPRSRNVLPGTMVFEAVRDAPDGRLQVYVVLSEDRYESILGDGTFHKFKAAFLDQETVRSFVAEKSGEAASEAEYSSHELGIVYHVREVYLTVAGDKVVLETEGCELSPFDHFTREQICNDLARRLG